MRSVEGPLFTMFGIIAGSAFLVAALRWLALRRYEGLLEHTTPGNLSSGSVHGIYSGRRADIGQVSANRASHTPSKVQVSLACEVPLRLEAHPRSLAISLRTAVGVLEERKSGVQDLDRRFVFQFDN